MTHMDWIVPNRSISFGAMNTDVMANELPHPTNTNPIPNAFNPNTNGDRPIL